MTEEDKKKPEDPPKQPVKPVQPTPPADEKPSEWLEAAKKLREEQDALKVERDKFEQERTDFTKVMKENEVAGQSLATPVVDEDDKKREEASKLLKGTGLKLPEKGEYEGY